MRIDLPWPARVLSPNARVHWAVKSNAVKASRSAAFMLTKEALSGAKFEPLRAVVSMTFHPPDKRRRDLDNAISMLKSGIDGIADALGIDDSRFVLRFQMGDVVKGGRVAVDITGEKDV